MTERAGRTRHLDRDFRHLLFSLLLPASATPWACGQELEGRLVNPELPRPHVLALSTYETSVGSVVDVHGTEFPDPSSGRATLHFEGVFEVEGGAVEPVDLEVEPRRVDSATLRWTSFGPYRNPFSSSGNEVGTFAGTVAARAYASGGGMLEDENPIDIRFKVLPSIIVHELQPLTASCNGVVKRALSGASYRLRVEAAGFDPASFTYTLAVPSLGLPSTSVRHLATGRFDSVGSRGDFSMPEVPEDAQSYGAIMTIEGRDSVGVTHQSSFAIAVHRPLEIFYDGNVDVAEVLAPAPVSACIPGGEAGRRVEYGETMEESRSRNYSVNWNESWLNTHTVSSGTSGTIGQSETNGIGFSTTDEENWNWSLGSQVEGTLGLSKLVSVGLSVTGSMGGGGSHSSMSSESSQRGIEASTTTTDTDEVSRSDGRQNGENFAWEVSSSQSISRGFGGSVIAGTYGAFYRQTLRLLRRAAVVTYNQCGAANIVGDVDFQDWTWSPDLALAASCPPLPKSNLPEARCVIPPCAGD